MDDFERKITALTQAAAQSYPGGTTAVVEILTEEDQGQGRKKRSRSTLYGDLSPYESSSGRLKVADKVRIQQITGNIEPLRYEAALFGCRLVRAENSQPDAPTMYEEFSQDHKALVDFHDACKAYRDGKCCLSTLLALRDAAHTDIDQSFTRTIEGDKDQV